MTPTTPSPSQSLIDAFSRRMIELRVSEERFSDDDITAIFRLNVVVVAVRMPPPDVGTWVSVQWPMAKLGKVLKTLPKKRRKKL